MPRKLPDWFQDEPFLAERLDALDIDAGELIDAASFLAMSVALTRRYIITGSRVDLEMLIIHAQFLRDLAKE